MGIRRPSTYSYPPKFNKLEDVENYTKRLYAELLENDSRGEEITARATDKDLKELFVRPEWYGAKGDGVTDDTAAIRAAETALGTTGGIVIFGAKTYLTQQIYYTSKDHFVGQGAGITTLKLKAASNTSLFTRADVYYAGGTGDGWPSVNAITEMTDVSIEGMTLDGNQANQTAPTSASWDWLVYFERVNGGYIRNCNIINGKTGGVIIQQCKRVVCENNYLYDCTQDGSDRNYITTFRNWTGGDYLTYPAGLGANIVRNNVADVPVAKKTYVGYGISAEYTTGDIIEGNTVFNGDMGGESCHTLSITNNKVYNGTITMSDTDNSYPYGNIICFNEVSYPSRSSTAAGVNGIGIGAVYNNNLTIVGNTVKNGTKTGAGPTWGYIAIGNCADSVIADNHVIAPTAYSDVSGVVVNDCDNTKVIGNDVAVNDSSGIYVASDGVKIIGNTILQEKVAADSYGVHTTGENCVIEGNSFDNFEFAVNSTTTGNNIIGVNVYTDCTSLVYESVQGAAIYGKIGSQKIYRSAAAPTAGTWAVGDICWKTSMSSEVTPGWFCTAAGTPGTWSEMPYVMSTILGFGTYGIYALTSGAMPYKESVIDTVADGAFENWTSPTDATSWTESLSGTSTINQGSGVGNVHGGSSSCRLDVDASNSTVYVTQGVTLVAGRQYTLSLWYKTEAAKTAAIQMGNSAWDVWLKADGSWTATNTLPELAASTSWKEYEINFTAHPSYTDYNIELGSGAGGWGVATSSSVYFDDLSISNVPILEESPLTTDGTDVDNSGVYKVSGVQVIGAQQAAITDADAGTLLAKFNTLLAELRTHGLIDTA
jgi:hypothetical protein